ncbi:MAG: glycosyltransferase family 4 protein [Rhodothermia bacterium]|nr:glycosyltransferase family 4 protein [Rhodothermia bacterium]
MKICIVKSKRVPDDLNTPTDGGSINFVEILKGLENHSSNSITVITRNEKENLKRSEIVVRNITIIYLPFTYSESDEVMIRDYEEGISFTNALNEHLNENYYDILHTHHWTSAVGLVNIKSHWVHTPHLLAFAKMKYVGFICPEYILLQEKLILQNCSRIIALSCAEKNDILENYQIVTNKITVIPNGVSDVFTKSHFKREAENDSFIISTVARITKQKRLEIIIQAVRNLVDEGFKIKLKIIGGDYYDNTYFQFLQEQILKYHISENIEFIGFITQLELSKIYAESILYVQSSYYESQGIAIIEAMTTGLPIVTTYQDALDEYFINGENGYFYNGDSSEELTKSLKSLLTNVELRVRISNHNINQSKTFSWQTTIEKTLIVLNPFEKNHRNTQMLKFAQDLGAEISESNNLAIAGSIAKGNAWSGSDVDFICVSDGDKKEDFYSHKNANVNIHYININKVDKILTESNIGKRTELLFENYLSEYLWKAIPLFEMDSKIASLIQLNSASRQTNEVKGILVKKYHTQANLFLSESKHLAKQEHFIQSTIELRKAILYLVISYKIDKGWIVQGSKKRPEQFKNLCETKTDFELFDFFVYANNLNLELTQILKFTNLRQDLRVKYLELLHQHLRETKKDKLKTNFIENEIKHNENLDNYYLQNLYNGYEVGAIYHIRQISGFKTHLNKISYLKTNYQETIIDKSITHIDKQTLDTWLQVMGLTDIRSSLTDTIKMTEDLILKHSGI